MTIRSSQRLAALAISGLLLLAMAGGAWWYYTPDPGDLRLAAFVANRPPVPVVFTSRTEPTAFAASAPITEGYTFPGTLPWAAREGRLRILMPSGAVHELTWNRPLPDGNMLIDVMSPSITLDGTRILFAGRKGGDDPGHFRLYEINLDGSELHPLTGTPTDDGCPELPPLRFAADGSRLADRERKRIDYDDVDPVEVSANPRLIYFASTRTPDLGRDHTRRSSAIWVLNASGKMEPMTANRNNDRWPFPLRSGYVGFSLWSRNREVVAADGRSIRPVSAEPGLTQPTDAWQGAFLRAGGGHFGLLIKPALPVWRPRPTFAGPIAFMTTTAGPGVEAPPLTVVLAEPGLIANAPSSVPGGLPHQGGAPLARGPVQDAAGRPLWLATPSPCPPSHLLMAAAAVEPGQTNPRPGQFGLVMTTDQWPTGPDPATIAQVPLRPLFDDPDLVDAEPVAVYPRQLANPPLDSVRTNPFPEIGDVTLESGQKYSGKVGFLLATAFQHAAMADLPGQTTDAGTGPIFTPPPSGAIDHLKIYAAPRDRFDDPSIPRIPGGWELLKEVTAKSAENSAGSILPATWPTVLAGFGRDGKIVSWTSPAADAAGSRATIYAYAGDHYSLIKAGGRHFCVGCHPGHSGLPRSDHHHAEQP